MPSFGPIHTIIVHEVGESYGPLSTEEFDDFEVIHPIECKLVHDEVFNYDRYDCAVEHQIDGCGARFCLNYVGTPITQPGEYQIRAWSEVYRGFDYTEYDGGIALEKPDV